MLTTKAQGRGIVAAKPSILEEADVRFGSKPENLNTSTCFPLFTQQRTSPRFFGMSGSCQKQKIVD